MSVIYCLIKICERESYADDFLSGCMYMNRLRYFTQIEDHDQRSDKYEGLTSWMQPNQIQLFIKDHLITDIIHPLTIRKKQDENCPILCLYTIHSGPYHSINEDNIIEFKKCIKVKDIVRSFGDSAVLITNVTEFLKRFRSTAQKKGIGFEASLVEYFSYDSHNPNFDRPGFHKLKKYSDQNEYRIKLYLDDDLETPYRIEIGDLSDIAVKMTTNDLLAKNVEIIFPNQF